MGKSNTGEALKLAKKLVEVLAQGADSSVQMPAPDDVADLEKSQLNEIAEAFNIEIEGKKASEVKSLIKTAACIVAEETDDVEVEDLTALCEAVGQQPAKKASATISLLADYFDTAKDTEDGDTSEDEDEDEKEEKSEDEDEDEDEDEEEKPKGKKGGKKKDEDEDEDESEDEDEDEDEKEDEDEDADESEVSEEEQEERLKAFNKVSKKKVKTYEELAKKLVDGEGDPVEWGVAYVKDDEAYCCGLPLATVKKNGKKVGKCQVTGKFFAQDEEGDLVEIEDEE